MRRPWILSAPIALWLALSLVAGGVAVAASLAISSHKLTVFQTTTSIAADTCTLTASADTFAAQEAGGTVVEPFLPGELWVQSRQAKNMRTFVKFDIASCVPSDALVVSASFRLFLFEAPDVSRTYQVRRITAGWAEDSLTWDNQPAAAGTPTDQVATGTTAGVTLGWNVAADVQSFVSASATNNGWTIRDQIEDEHNKNAQLGKFSSKDQNVNPEPTLVITYYP